MSIPREPGPSAAGSEAKGRRRERRPSQGPAAEGRVGSDSSGAACAPAQFRNISPEFLVSGRLCSVVPVTRVKELTLCARPPDRALAG
jgi:hypothetical protein